MSIRRTPAIASPLTALVCLSSAFDTSTSWADSFGCAVMPKAEDVSVTVRGQVYEAPVRLKDCEGAMVTGGDALVCYAGGDGRRKCRTVEDGARIDLAALGGQGGREWGAFGILAMLMGDQQVRTGVSKGPGGDPSAPLPVGDTLSSEARASLGLAPMVARPDLLDLTYPIRLRLLRHPRSEVYWIGQRRPRAVTIPADLLTPGAEYAWEINGIAGGASGAFRIIGAEATAALSAELESVLSDPSLEPLARALITADVLLSRNLAWDAKRVLEGALAANHLSAAP